MTHFSRLALLSTLLTLAACGVDNASITTDDGSDASQDELTVLKGRFETFTGRDGQTYFHLLAGNGEKVLASEGYAAPAGAEAGIASVRTNGLISARYLLREASDGSWYFVLTAANGSIIGVSEMYVSQSNAARAVSTVVNVVKNSQPEAPALPGNAKFEVFKGLDGQYYFHLKAGNGEIVMQSEGYASKSGANSGVASVRVNGALTARYQVRPAADGKFYFVLRAANNQVIGRGETYVSQSNAERGVTACVDILGAVR